MYCAIKKNRNFYFLNLSTKLLLIQLKKIAIFASGNGSNANQIISYFSKPNSIAKVQLVITNNKQAGVINKAKSHGVPVFILENSAFENDTNLVYFLQQNKIDLIVLAGFLRKINVQLLKAFPNKIINIHPSLLPLYGGKGMYGNKVHESVIANNEKTSGITIHYASEIYDDGAIIHQSSCTVEAEDTAKTLAAKIHQLEQENFPKVLVQILEK
jgi:phosphoribosylglycinamide formyltransferase-1